VRIIAGRAGGTRLKAPSGHDVRPTSDRVKEAVFASLGDIQGYAVADLFSGSGALGLEALSRGATTVYFVEVPGSPEHDNARWLEELLRGARGAGLHTALDTCGLTLWKVYERMLPLVDLVLYDLFVR